ncbi:alpha/beta fold hydrolase [Dactylosporangium sp. NPDC005572]|uniref:alpha/beta fold hydrolase n=1 Tax=Dactylosporangium sp. NPDC005572 TaxID=3156889 RepID=UPI0033B8EA1F
MIAATRLGGSGERLLVVGPSLGTSVEALWERTAALLGDVEVIGWDLPGHGRSPAATAPFTVADLAGAVAEQGSRAGGRPVWYAGVSIGGAVGFQLAARPTPFAGVVAIAAAPRIGTAGAWHERAALVRRSGTAALVPGAAGRWFAPGFAGREPAVAASLLRGLAGVDAESYALACEALAAFDLRGGAAVVPLAVLPGEFDVVVPPSAVAALHPAVLAGCGHLPPVERPAETAAAIRRAMRLDGGTT